MVRKVLVVMLWVCCWCTPELVAKPNGFAVETIVIDAGHGGKDPGAIGVTGLKEKDVALKVALKVGHYIQKYMPDVQVIYTREDDRFLELHERASIANEAKADLFVSIHANSAGTKRDPNGTETFVLGLHKSKANLEVAKRENAVIELESNQGENYDFDPQSEEGHIIMAMKQSVHLGQSISLASKIENQFTERVHRNSRGVKQAGFFVLYKTTMPSVLVETGFLSNPKEEKYLKGDTNLDYLASAIYRAVKSYKQEQEGALTEYKSAEPTPDQEAMVEKPKKSEKPIAKKQEKLTGGLTEKVTTNNNVIFRVQISAGSQKLEGNSPMFNDYAQIKQEKTASGMYRFLVGNYPNYESAGSKQLEAIQKGYKDAFVVAYQNGKRISISKALASN